MPSSPLIEPMLMMEPLPRRAIAGDHSVEQNRGLHVDTEGFVDQLLGERCGRFRGDQQCGVVH
jgi:hypothetical protein